MTKKMTEMRLRFIEEYPIDLNGTQAAIRAGYSKKTARSQAQRLLKNADIKAAVEAKLKERAKKADLTAAWVLDELRNLAGSNILDYVTMGANGLPIVDMANITRAQAAAIQSVKVDQSDGKDGPVASRVDFKLSDKRAALELIGKHLGMFSDKLQLSGPDGGPIEVATPDSLDLARRLAFILAKAQKDQEAASG